jgi:hypothetical protein
VVKYPHISRFVDIAQHRHHTDNVFFMSLRAERSDLASRNRSVRDCRVAKNAPRNEKTDERQKRFTAEDTEKSLNRYSLVVENMF